MQDSRCRRLTGLMLGLAVLLGGCTSLTGGAATDDGINVRPVNYKAQILGAMHAYLNDPTGIRDAGIAEPALKPVGAGTRYVVCVRYNARKGRNQYVGVKEAAAVFVAGRFDRFVATAHGTSQDQCAGAVYAPFPELQKLTP